MCIQYKLNVTDRENLYSQLIPPLTRSLAHLQEFKPPVEERNFLQVIQQLYQRVAVLHRVLRQHRHNVNIQSS